ncbi:hypothetical protein MC885_017547 [Smutsia gigantea]|nr:hypothetical protein MC885_017547 [Smutsia gigantea]
MDRRKIRCFPTTGSCSHGARVLHLCSGPGPGPPFPWPVSACKLRGWLAGVSPRPCPDPRLSVPSRVPVVTEEVAREALRSFVNSKCCYGSGAAGDLIIRELRRQTLCRYRLETFSESRISEWTFQPYTNHSVDGPQRGTSPRLWDIDVQVPPMFQEDTRKFQVPHSSLVKECHKCHGRGRYKCSGCHGAGMRSQAQSQAAPEVSDVLRVRPAEVQHMLGAGEQDLYHLQGGEETLAFHPAGHHVHHLNCPGELLAKAKGANLFKDENTMVYPVVDFPVREISLASQRGIAEHSAALASRARVLQQTYVYYVYGTDHRVYVADYPEQYCCGCSIL